MDARIETNRRMWDERVPVHVGGSFYDVEGFKAGRETLLPWELEEVGDVTGLDLVHLQCHFGLDTMSWARHGARAWGVDFSAPAIAAATRIAAELQLDAQFVVADVDSAESALHGRRFDVVYTGHGALNWLPDIGAWACVVAALLKPGGRLYLSEFHPLCTVIEEEGGRLVLAFDYFADEPQFWDEPGTYADRSAPTVENAQYEWCHGIGAVVTALFDAGLVLDSLRERDLTLFPRYPMLVRGGERGYRFPPGAPRMPLLYSLVAHRPGPNA